MTFVSLSRTYLKTRIASFGYAFEGLFQFFSGEAHARVHLVAIICVIMTGVAVSFSVFEWVLVIFACTLVVVSEAINTAIESLCDVVTTEHHAGIKKTKDIAASAVLMASFAALLIALSIFYMRIYPQS